MVLFFGRVLTLILLETKVINQLAFASSTENQASLHIRAVWPQRLYTIGWLISSSHLDIPKNDNGQFQKMKVDYSI